MDKIKTLSNGNYIKLNIDKLLKVREEFSKNYVTRVGIIGSKTNRLAQAPDETHKQYKARTKLTLKAKFNHGEVRAEQAGELTNAEIGFIHENGSQALRIPRRSFLEMPLNLKIPDYYAKLGPQLMRAINDGNIRKMYVDLGIKGEQIVQQAFASRGFGQWAPNAPYTIQKKKSSQPLIDTAQLRKSISSDVVTR